MPWLPPAVAVMAKVPGMVVVTSRLHELLGAERAMALSQGGAVVVRGGELSPLLKKAVAQFEQHHARM